MARDIRIEGDIAFIPLTKGYETVIDAADVNLACDWIWHALVSYRKDGSVRSVYAVRKSQRNGGVPKNIYLHRVISAAPSGMETDHRDGDGLNNRRANIRIVTSGQNSQNMRKALNNASGMKGVSWHRAGRKWHAQIMLNGKSRHLGLFANLEDAAAAYQAAKTQIHPFSARGQA